MMGSGKSTIGEVLSSLSQIPFQDLDESIEETSQMKISTIFESYGEAHFRKLEREALRIVCSQTQGIIALGGGTLCSEESWKLVPSHAHIIWLKAPLETLVERVEKSSHRPLVAKGARKKMASLLASRSPWYEKASIHIHTASKSPQDIAKEVLEHMHSEVL